MALPTSMKLWSGGLVPTGIEIGLFPSTQRRLSMELQASTVGSTASSVWTSVAIPAPRPGGVMTYRYNIPMSTRRYYFRARHGAQEGLSDGAFTAKISAKPVILIDYIPPHPMVNAIGNVEVPGANIFISSGNKPKVGSQNTTSYISKFIRLAADAFRPAANTYKATYAVGKLSIGSTGSSAIYQAALTVPNGVTVTKVEYFGYRRGSTARISKLEVYSLNAVGGSTLISTITMTTGSTVAPILRSSSALTLAISTARSLVGRFYLKNTADANNPSLIYVDVNYTMPDYSRAY